MIGGGDGANEVRVSVPAFPRESVNRSLDILLVEDEAELRQVIARNLTGRGHLVREAATASQAIEMATAIPPDLMLLDINLPDQSGWDVLRELRRRGTEIVTVVVSAVRVSPSRLAEFELLAYLPKPFPLESLLRIVEGVAELREPGKPSEPPGFPVFMGRSS